MKKVKNLVLSIVLVSIVTSAAITSPKQAFANVIDEKLDIKISEKSVFMTEQEKKEYEEKVMQAELMAESLKFEEDIIKKFEEKQIEFEVKEREDEREKRIEERRIAEEKRIADEKEAERVAFIKSRGGNPDFKGSLPERALQEALTQIGKPYIWGGQTTRGFDCSGILVWAYNRQGKSNLNRTTRGQWQQGQGVSRRNIQRGDLIYFRMNRKNSPVDHVGIYLGGGKMFHAPKPGDVLKIAPVPWGAMKSIRRHLN